MAGHGGSGSPGGGTGGCCFAGQGSQAQHQGAHRHRGGGLGGIAIANRLSSLLDGARLTLIDAKQEHNYQPGYTLVGTGIWPVEKVINRNADYHPSGLNWIQEMAAGFDPQSNTVITAGGQKVRYDYLVVATGTHQDWSLIEGMDVQAIGSNGLASVYPSPQAAVDTWKAMQAFTAKGGEAVMTLPSTPLKCAGAPLKLTFMVRDRLLQAGTLAKSKVTFHSALKDTVFLRQTGQRQRAGALGQAGY